MRDFAKVAPQFWIGKTAKEIRRFGRDCQVVAMYLITCPSASALGLYYLPIPTLSHETGIPAQGALKALQRLSEAGFCHYDPAAEWVFVPKMARFQIGGRLELKDNRVKWIRRELEAFGKSPFLNDFLKLYRDDFHLQDVSPSEVPSEAPRSQETETETEKETENIDRVADAPRLPDGSAQKRKLKQELDHRFSDFWAVYPRKAAKADAAAAWQKVDLHECDKIIADVKRRTGTEWSGKETTFIPYPATYLRGRRWEDEVELPRVNGAAASGPTNGRKLGPTPDEYMPPPAKELN